MTNVESFLLKKTNKEDAIRGLSENFDFVEVIDKVYKEYDKENKHKK